MSSRKRVEMLSLTDNDVSEWQEAELFRAIEKYNVVERLYYVSRAPRTNLENTFPLFKASNLRFLSLNYPEGLKGVKSSEMLWFILHNENNKDSVLKEF